MQQGGAASCAEVTATGGLHASDCTTTTVVTAAATAIDVRVAAPTRLSSAARQPSRSTFANRGQTAADGLMLKNRFPPGLEHAAATAL